MFGAPEKIDVILGADQLWNIYSRHRREFGIEYPIALHANFDLEDLDFLVGSFIDMGRVHPSKPTIDASDPAEQHFLTNHARREDGVHIVQYAFKKPTA